MIELPYAEDVNYFQTSQSSPDAWIEKSRRLVESIGGIVLAEGFGSTAGYSAYMLTFQLDSDRYRVVFPVLPVRTKSHERAARVQAATLLYHDIKAKCMTSLVLGLRSAFFSYLMLPNGRTAAEVSVPELMENLPLLLKG